MPATSFGTAHAHERVCARSPRPSPSRCAFPNSAIGAPRCNVRVNLRAPAEPSARYACGQLWLPYPVLRQAALRPPQAREIALTAEACDSDPRFYDAQCQAAKPAEEIL